MPIITTIERLVLAIIINRIPLTFQPLTLPFALQYIIKKLQAEKEEFLSLAKNGKNTCSKHKKKNIIYSKNMEAIFLLWITVWNMQK